MPPIRTVPAIKPVRTERTHEENQERAYIAASRRSDRSLEARVESARRASEIHKKRTGRSLRVREQDVMNEEMYEEEDDDLPMQYRRINALHPGLGLTPLNERFNSYLAGQIGVRNYLHQAIFQANQMSNNNHFLNPTMQRNGFQMGATQPQPSANGNSQTPWQPQGHARSASVATPQGFAQQQQNINSERSMTPAENSTRRLSVPIHSENNSSSSHPDTPYDIARPSQSPVQTATAPHSAQTMSQSTYEQMNAQMFPLTTTLPVEAQQLIDGQPGYNVHPFQMSPNVPMPSMSSYSYNPNGLSKKQDSGSGEQTGLNQTLSPFAFQTNQVSPLPYQEPQSALSAPANLDFFSPDMYSHDTKYAFDIDFGSGANTGNANNSGQVTPAGGMDNAWNMDDFFNYAAASD